jgi:His-Xaa-Ser system protein HxsD
MKDIKVDEKENACIIKLNQKVYPLDVIYSAAYVFIDKAYIILDEDSKKNISVFLKPKKKMDLNELGGEFYNELLNYAQYKTQAEKNKAIRETIIQRALITNDPSIIEEENLFDKDIDEYLDDPEGIAIPWEEKYGDKKK